MCNGIGGQEWQQQANGTLLDPQSGLCLDDPGGNRADGTQLVISSCQASAEELFIFGD